MTNSHKRKEITSLKQEKFKLIERLEKSNWNDDEIEFEIQRIEKLIIDIENM